MTRLELAQSQAKISGRPILMHFGGSDWCTWCMKLDQEVMRQQEFQEWAKSRVILLQLDFSRTVRLSEEEQRWNEEMIQRYGVEGFPAVLLLDFKGAELARTGYRPGGAAAYIGHLNELLKQRLEAVGEAR